MAVCLVTDEAENPRMQAKRTLLLGLGRGKGNDKNNVNSGEVDQLTLKAVSARAALFK